MGDSQLAVEEVLQTMCFNPNQISAYYGGIKIVWSVVALFLVSIRIKSRLIMGATPDVSGLEIDRVSIRIKSRLIMGDAELVHDSCPKYKKFQSESNLGLLWGALIVLSPGCYFRFNPNQISAYYGGRVTPVTVSCKSLCFNPNQISAYYGGE